MASTLQSVAGLADDETEVPAAQDDTTYIGPRAARFLQDMATKLRDERVGPSSSEKWWALAAALAKPVTPGQGRVGQVLGNVGETMSAYSAAKAKAEKEKRDLVAKYDLETAKVQDLAERARLTAAAKAQTAASAAAKPINVSAPYPDPTTGEMLQTYAYLDGTVKTVSLAHPEKPPIVRPGGNQLAAPGASPSVAPVQTASGAPAGRTLPPPAPIAGAPAAAAAPAAAKGEEWKAFIGKTVSGKELGPGFDPDAVYMPTEAGPGAPLPGARTFNGDEALRISGGRATSIIKDEKGWRPASEKDLLPTPEQFQTNLNGLRRGVELETAKLNKVKQLVAQITPYTTGPIGAAMAFVPGSAAMGVRGRIISAVSDIALDKLGELKDQSRTGASGLGSTTEREIEMLKDSIAALNQQLSPKDFKANADAVIKHYNAALASMRRDGQASYRLYNRVQRIVNPEPEAKVRVYNPKTGKFE